MSTRKQMEEKREFARLLYLQGTETNKSIAERVGTSEVNIARWAVQYGWREARAAQNITRPELVNKLLRAIDKLIDEVNRSDDPSQIISLSDKLTKFAASIAKLDRQTTVVDVVEVFMAFSKWMQYQSQYDDAITPELLRTFNDYHNKYINHLISMDKK